MIKKPFGTNLIGLTEPKLEYLVRIVNNKDQLWDMKEPQHTYCTYYSQFYKEELVIAKIGADE